MLSDNNNKKYSPINPYEGQSPVKGKTDSWDENTEMEIYDSSQYDYDRLRNKRQEYPEMSQLDFVEPSVEPENNKEQTENKEVKELFLTPLYAITGFFAAMFIIGPFLVGKGPNRGIVQSCIMIAAFCMWIFWFTIYFGQMNPLMGPRLDNTTVAWIAYKLGNNVTPSDS